MKKEIILSKFEILLINPPRKNRQKERLVNPLGIIMMNVKKFRIFNEKKLKEKK